MAVRLYEEVTMEDRCVSCGATIPDGRQVCVNCIAACTGCGWEDKENCRACNKDKLEQTLRSILDAERERIGGKR